MSQLKMNRNKGRKEAVGNMDKTFCNMIVKYHIRLVKEGINVMANVAKRIVNIHDSNEEKEYINLDTIGKSEIFQCNNLIDVVKC